MIHRNGFPAAQLRRQLRLAAMGLALLATAGCEQAWLNGFLDPTQVGRFGMGPKRRELRRTLSVLIEEPEGVPGAGEPTREDLVVKYAETVIAPGDVIEFSVFELLQLDTAYREQLAIDETGYVTLPEIGRYAAAGKTPRGVEIELTQMLKDMQKLSDPQVSIRVAQSQSKRYTVLGAVSRPGTFGIPRPDFRLLDAIGDVGGVSPEIKTVYLIRTMEAPPGSMPAMNAAGASTQSQPTGNSAQPSDIRLAAMPGIGYTARVATATMMPRMPQPPEDTASQPASAPGAPRIEPLLPPPATKPKEPGLDELNEASKQDKAALPFFYDRTRGWVQGTAPSTATTQEPLRPITLPGRTRPPPGPTATTPASGPAMAPSVDWTQLAQPDIVTRIIAVPTEPLLNGDVRYNIVIRPNDVINVAPGPIGEFYVMGNVLRPGAYSLTGREVDVRAAIAAAGGFGPLATPGRAELIRRGTGDQEEIRPVDLDAIFAGKSDNFYMKPNDIINVGTNALMPFVATIRSAFRVSYGFGFVYDRNFADIDSFSAQQNPNDRRRIERLQRGFPPGF